VKTQLSPRGNGLERIEAVIADANAALEAVEVAAARNQPDAFDLGRTRFEALRNRAAQLLSQLRNRAAIAPAALAAVEDALERLDEVTLPPRPDGIVRIDAEAALEALRTAVVDPAISHRDRHRRINEKVLAIVATLSRTDSDVLLHRLLRRSARDPLACWLASRINLDEVLRLLRDPKRRASLAT
jgi:hypothetical protein